jgi:hypothetical protein
MSTPPINPAIGIVMIQLYLDQQLSNKQLFIQQDRGIGRKKTYENIKRPTRLQLTALNEPLQRPTPTVAPVIHIEVDTGSLYCEKMRMVMEAPSSIEDPREGEW